MTQYPDPRAHRSALILSGVELRDDQFALHSCDNPPCCNPRHLRPGTAWENAQDRLLRDRANMPKGEAHHWAKLTNSQVDEIKRLAVVGMAAHEVAGAFGVSWATVARYWRSVGRRRGRIPADMVVKVQYLEPVPDPMTVELVDDD